MRVRVSPYLLSLIDWSDPVQRSAAHAVHPARLAPAARSPEARPRLAARAGRRAGARAHPPLPRQGAVPRARHLPGLLPLLHAQLRGRHRHRRGREGPAQGQRRALGAGVRVHRARAPSSRTSSSRAATLPAARRADHADRRDAAARDRPHPPHPLRDQGPGGDAAEDPHRRRVDRRADRASSSAAASCHKEVVLHTHFNHPQRDHRRSPSAAMDRLFERGITVRNQAVLQRGVNDSVDDDEAAGQAPRPRQRAPVLRLRARPGEGRRGPAHHAADRRSTSRRTCAASTAGFNTPTVRGRRARRRRQARRALATSTTTATTGISVFTAPAVKPGRVLLLLRSRSTRCRPRARRAGPTPPSRRRMVDEAARRRGRRPPLTPAAAHWLGAAATALLLELRVQLRHHARRHRLGPPLLGRVVATRHRRVHLVEQALGLRGASLSRYDIAR